MGNADRGDLVKEGSPHNRATILPEPLDCSAGFPSGGDPRRPGA